jgi:hypothetical protein
MTIISVQNLLEKCHDMKFLHDITFWRPLYISAFTIVFVFAKFVLYC